MDKKTISKISKQFNANEWPQFLKSVTINNLRGINETIITFDYPITVIVGENGSRKSTILKSVACAYLSDSPNLDTYYPSDFFVDTAWERISNVTLDYTYLQGTNQTNRRISKHTSKWSYPEKRPKRNVFFFDVSRTLPLDATIGYSRIAKKSAKEVATNNLSDENVEALSRVLGRTYQKARFASTDKDEKKLVGLLTRDFGEFSQFHQGAGEDATLDLFKVLQEIPKYSLLIIDEVEASLHPKAQRKLVDYLVKLSLDKKIQIILSTHSPYILSELPEEARLLLLQNNDELSVVKGPSTEFALSRIDDVIHPELHIFVEDIAARTLVIEMIRKKSPEILPRINIIPAGTAEVLKSLAKLKFTEKLPYKSLIILDGDMPSCEGAIKLPGTLAPEIIIFNDLKDKNWSELEKRFGVGAGDLYSYLDNAMLEEDHHKWCSLVGDRILKSRESVWEVLSERWVHICCPTDTLNNLVESVEENLL